MYSIIGNNTKDHCTILSSALTNTAKEQDGHGLLTGYVLTTLNGECEQAINQQGKITIASLFDYLTSVMSSAREHYISHLYEALDREKLFRILDESHYGKAKVKSDPSMRSYVLDLDLEHNTKRMVAPSQ